MKSEEGPPPPLDGLMRLPAVVPRFCEAVRLVEVVAREMSAEPLVEEPDMSLKRLVVPRVAPGHDLALVRLDGPKGEAREPRELEVGRKDRRAHRDRVALGEDAVRQQAFERVRNPRRAPLDREQVQLTGRRPVVAERLGQVTANDLLGVEQHPLGQRVARADHRVAELVNEGVGVEAEPTDAVLKRSAE